MKRSVRVLSWLSAALLAATTSMCAPHEDGGGPGRLRATPRLPGDGGAGGGATGPSSSSSSSTGAGAGGTAEIPPEACRFEPAVAFALPSGFDAEQLDDVAADDSSLCVEGELSYGLRDMDGDLRPDLVVTDRCDHGEVGTTEWLVYLHQGDRFAEEPLAWALPGGYALDQLDDLADDGGTTCVEGELSYGLLDMDGDLRPDLVVTDRCDHAGVGTSHWSVYLNQGDGFADLPLAWSLPFGYGADALDDLQKDESNLCVVGELSYATIDLNGDERPELVVTDACDHEGVGTEHWLVYVNDGAGFSSNPIYWSLPSGFTSDDFDDVAGDGGACFEGELSYGLRDLDGDLRPDLVVTDACDHGGVGTEHWLIYFNDGDGFVTTPTEWSLPGWPNDALDDLQTDEGAGCVEGELSFAVLDADGDRAADLVVTDFCDHEHVGTTHWLVLRAETEGFAAPAAFTLPAGYGFDALDDLAADDGALCVQGELSYAAMDLDGDRVLDLVVADDCDVDGVGTGHWRFYRGVCD